MFAAILMSTLVLAATQGAPAPAGETGGNPHDHTYGGADRGTPPSQGGGGATGRPAGPIGPAIPDRRLTTYALDAAERAASDARESMRRGDLKVARAHARNLHDWLGLAARLERPSGESAQRWDFAAREARRLDGALLRGDVAGARWADAALTLALADARASLGGGGGRTEPDWDMEVAPDAGDPRRVTDPAKKYENVPLERQRPWYRGL